MEQIDRRKFIGTNATLLFSFSIAGCRGLRATVAEATELASVATGEYSSLYLRVTPNNEFHLTFDKTEMGQGVITGQATLFGEEADIAPHRFVMHPATADRRYGTIMGVQITGGSTSTAERWEVLRQAGAEYRHAVLKAAAESWKVAITELRTDDGHVLHPTSGERLPYATFNVAIAKMEPESAPALKPESEFKYIGKYSQSIDAEEKSTGKAQFGLDDSVPDMRVAIVLRKPTVGAKLKTFDAAGVSALQYVEAVHEIPSGVAVICRRYWQCQKVRAQITAAMLAWDIPEAERYTSDKLYASFRDSLEPLPTDSKSDQAVVSAEYTLPYLSHAALEPQSVLAWKQADRFDIWISTQAPTFVKGYAQTRSGMDFEKIHVHVAKYLGGGFGRRGWLDVIAESVELAVLVSYPVKIIWSREDDMRYSPLRPMGVHRLSAELKDNKVSAWNHQIAVAPLVAGVVRDGLRYMLPEWMPNMMKGGIGAALGGMMNLAGADPIASEGAKQAYDLPYDLSTVVQDVKLPTAFWRSVANSHNGFVVESFVDEVAAALKINPLEFRQQLLAKDQRALNVLNLVAEKSQFMRLSPRRGYGFGIAYHKSFESHVAEVAEVEVSDGQIKVLKVTCAVDCGRVVNPHIVVAQMRSGIIFGLSAALYGKITFRDGVAEQDNYDTYPILKLSETPAIDVHIVASTANPTGVGEPGLPPIAAAVANAVTMATGKRPRDLPFVLVS